jgi:hypothetical protein
MAELKTKKTDSSVNTFLESIDDEQKKKASYVILDLMKEVTGAEPKMWGESIVGFGEYHYKYASGREGDWLITGFSPRKQSLTLYLTYGFEEHKDLLSRLGKYKTGKACLYIKRLEDINQTVLKELVQRSVEKMKASS